MKKIKSTILVIIILILLVFVCTGCTLTVETTSNSVTASVDGNTTEQVDGILEWIKERINRVINTNEISKSVSEKI